MEIFNFLTPLGSGVENFKDKKEGLNTKSQTYSTCQLIVAIGLGIVAAWLSFQCNELGPDSSIGAVILQIVYAIVAFLFGGLYILYYMVVHWVGDGILANAGFASSCPSGQIAKKE